MIQISTICDVVNALLIACEYMNENEVMYSLCKELQTRVQGFPCAWSENGNKIFSVLVLLYGDYGVNPQSGWIENRTYQREICKIIECYAAKLKESEEWQ